MAIASFTLTGTYQNLDGSPASGKVRVDVVSPTGGRVIDPDGNVVFAGPRTVVLDTAGHFSLGLPSDVSTGESATIAYRVTAQLKHNNLAPVEFWAKASGSTWDVADIDTQVVVPLTPTAVTTSDLDTRTATNINTAGSSTQTALSATYVSHAGNGSADDTARLNALLASGGYVKGKPGQTYTISAPLVIGSDTTLDMTGSTVRWKDGVSGDNLIRNAAYTAQRTVTDAATTAGSTTLTSASAAFTAADVGRTVCVTGAGGASGAPTILTAEISSVTNATTVVLNRPARLAVTAATMRIHQRDKNIRIVGGVWDRGAAVGDTGYKLHGLQLRHIDNLIVDIDTYRATALGCKYAVLVGSVYDARITAKELDNKSDGVHINGPSARIEIPYLAGYTYDDMVSLTGADYPHYADTAGDITDVTVGTLHGDGVRAGYKILAGAGNRIDNFTGGHFTGSTSSYAAWVGADENYPDTMGGTYGQIDLGVMDVAAGGELVRCVDATVQRVKVTPRGTSGTDAVIKIMQGAGNVGGRIDNLILTDPRVPTGQTLLILAGSNVAVGRAQIDRVGANGTGYVVNVSAGTIDHAVVSNGNITYTGAYAPFVTSGGSMGALTLVDSDVNTASSTGVGAVFQRMSGAGCGTIRVIRGSITGAGSTRGLVAWDPSTAVCNLILDNCRLVTLKRAVDGVGAGITATLTNPSIDTALEPFHIGAGGATIQGSVGSLTHARIVTTTSAGGIRVNGATLPADVSALTPQANDLVKNTAATTGANWFVGLVTYDATDVRWVPVRGYADKGTVTLAGGTATVSNTKLKTYSRIRLMAETLAGAPGALYVSSRTAGTGFTITSTSATDTSVVRWEVIAY